jgi:hypothetical protein
LRDHQVEAMSPVDRQQLADQCRRITALVDPSPQGATVKGGVLADLQARRRGRVKGALPTSFTFTDGPGPGCVGLRVVGKCQRQVEALAAW